MVATLRFNPRQRSKRLSLPSFRRSSRPQSISSGESFHEEATLVNLHNFRSRVRKFAPVLFPFITLYQIPGLVGRSGAWNVSGFFIAQGVLYSLLPLFFLGVFLSKKRFSLSADFKNSWLKTVNHARKSLEAKIEVLKKLPRKNERLIQQLESINKEGNINFPNYAYQQILHLHEPNAFAVSAVGQDILVDLNIKLSDQLESLKSEPPPMKPDFFSLYQIVLRTAERALKTHGSIHSVQEYEKTLGRYERAFQWMHAWQEARKGKTIPGTKRFHKRSWPPVTKNWFQRNSRSFFTAGLSLVGISGGLLLATMPRIDLLYKVAQVFVVEDFYFMAFLPFLASLGGILMAASGRMKQRDLYSNDIRLRRPRLVQEPEPVRRFSSSIPQKIEKILWTVTLSSQALTPVFWKIFLSPLTANIYIASCLLGIITLTYSVARRFRRWPPSLFVRD